MIDLFYAVSVLIQLLCLPLGLEVQGSTPGAALVAGQIRFGDRPLPGVKLVLRPERMTARDDLRETQSDEHGNYRITGLRAGTYLISLRDDEFIVTGAVFNVSGGRGKRLHLSEGEHLENLDLELTRGSVIIGRVTDVNGRPLVRERIELTRVNEDGKPQDTPFNQPGLSITDEQGIYHLRGLPAGCYLISVGTPSEAGPGRPSANSSAYTRTFYPGVTDPAQAKAVEIIAGVEVTGINLLNVAAKRTYVIRGRVVSAVTGEPVAGAEIRYGTLIAGLPRVSGWRPSRERSNEVGEFQIPGLVTGKYAIYARALPERELFSDAMVLEIIDDMIDGVELKIGRGAALSGVVVIEGTDDPDVLAKLSQIQLVGNNVPEKPLITPYEPASVNPDGSFHLKGLQSGKIKFGLVVPAAGGWFRIKRVEREGISQHEGIELLQNEHLANVRVVISPANLTLRGEVRVIGGTLPAYLGLSVNANRLHEEIPSGNTAFVDARGQFVIEQLMPGEYEVRVISLMLQPGEPRDPQLLKLIAGARQKITIDGGSRPKITFVIDLTQKASQ